MDPKEFIVEYWEVWELEQEMAALCEEKFHDAICYNCVYSLYTNKKRLHCTRGYWMEVFDETI